MPGTELGPVVTVRCKWCGALNRKPLLQPSATCRECGRETFYIVPMERRRPV